MAVENIADVDFDMQDPQFAADTAFKIGNQAYTIQTVRNLFDSMQAKTHWKDPITTKCQPSLVELLTNCIVWFHGGTVQVSAPDAEGFVTLTNAGYAC